MNLLRLTTGVDTGPILMALARNPELWGAYSMRKAGDSPHKDMTDIWVRYRDIREFNGDHKAFNGPHFPVFYPAWYGIREIQTLVFELMYRFRATHLGGVLITKIAPGGVIKPHIDKSWHADFYETKLYVVLQGNDKCWNRVGDERAVMQTGEVWYFNNSIEHEVVNDGDTDRITLIICLRCE